MSVQVHPSCVPAFCGFFTDVDRLKEELGMDSYGIYTTTLEEVFLQIAEEEEREALESA